jgi:hypothetical protein
MAISGQKDGQTWGKYGQKESIKPISYMTQEQIDAYLVRKILRKQGQNEYRLRRPLQITVRSGVITQLLAMYPDTYEAGGILEAEIAGNGSLVIDRFHEVPNVAVKSYNYQPHYYNWENTIGMILERGNLPIPLHTHPRRLGIESYDSKRAKFYLKSSKADRHIARNGVTDYLNLPEAIFVKEAGLENGFGLVFYTGTIFPGSVTALTTLQYVALGAAALAFGRNNLLFGLASGAFVFDFVRHPEYKLEKSGDFVVKLVS